jgi:hypothetical protein
VRKAFTASGWGKRSLDKCGGVGGGQAKGGSLEKRKEWAKRPSPPARCGTFAENVDSARAGWNYMLIIECINNA